MGSATNYIIQLLQILLKTSPMLWQLRCFQNL